MIVDTQIYAVDPSESPRHGRSPSRERDAALRRSVLYSPTVHNWSEESDQLANGVFEYAKERLKLDPLPLDNTTTRSKLETIVGQTITHEGIGGSEALRIFADHLAPACITANHPRYLAFIPCAPTEASMLFDLIVGASCMYGSTWLEAAGAVFAENQALRWIADLAGFPEAAGGVFVQGGTLGNLSALVTARHATASRPDRDRHDSRRWAIAVSPDAHSSLSHAARVMDVDLVVADVDEDRKLRGRDIAQLLDLVSVEDRQRVFAVTATAGTTNLGVIDDLASIAEVCRSRDLWFHVDGAYGLAALAAPSVRGRFEGIEEADSFIVDPHKWLFSPFDCAALIYRDPELARATHTQHASYLEPLEEVGAWNPADYAIHLTRRARGLPFWFSLATYGTDRYSEAIEQTLRTARYAADAIKERSYLSLLREPELSVVCYRRTGWSRTEYNAWSERLRNDGVAFVTPSTHLGETIARLAIVNPLTTEDDIDIVLDSMS
ncbi:MAG: aminotransferase class V-fold PLP-dependent enzyme [Acidimicrobiales bacterium]